VVAQRLSIDRPGQRATTSRRALARRGDCGKSFAIRINANQTGAGESGDGNHERYGKAA
jgi:hypothetical protein